MKCQDEKEDLEQRCKRLMQSIASAAEVGYSGFNAVFDFKRRFVDVLIVSSTNSKGDYLQSFEVFHSLLSIVLALLDIDLPNRDVMNGAQPYPRGCTDLPNENRINKQGPAQRKENLTNGERTYQMEIGPINERDTDVPNVNSNERCTDIPNENNSKRGTDLRNKNS